MILDNQLLLSDAQAVTAAAASTHIVDLGAARDIGVGQELYVFVHVDVAMTDSNSDSSVTVTLEGDSTDSFSPDGSDVLFTIPAVSAAGSKFYARINPGFAANYRYVRLKYTPNNGNLSAGSFTAGIVLNVQSEKQYADNLTIS